MHATICNIDIAFDVEAQQSDDKDSSLEMPEVDPDLVIRIFTDEDLVAPGPEYYKRDEVVSIARAFIEAYQFGVDPKSGEMRSIGWGYIVSDSVDADGKVEVQTGPEQKRMIPWRHLAIVRIGERDAVRIRTEAVAKYGALSANQDLKLYEYLCRVIPGGGWNSVNVTDKLFTLELETQAGILIEVQQKDVVRSNMHTVRAFLSQRIVTGENDMVNLAAYSNWHDDDWVWKTHKLFYHDTPEDMQWSDDETEEDEEKQNSSYITNEKCGLLAGNRRKMLSRGFKNARQLQCWKELPKIFSPERRRRVNKPNEEFPNIGLIIVRWECCFWSGSRWVYLSIGSSGTGCIISDDGNYMLTAAHVVCMRASESRFLEKLQLERDRRPDMSESEFQMVKLAIERRAIENSGYIFRTGKEFAEIRFHRCQNGMPRKQTSRRDRAETLVVNPDSVVMFNDSRYLRDKKTESDLAICKLYWPAHTVGSRKIEKISIGVLQKQSRGKAQKKLIDSVGENLRAGVWGDSGDMDMKRELVKGTYFDPSNVTPEECKQNLKEDFWTITNKSERLKAEVNRQRLWGHVGEILCDANQIDSFSPMICITHTWHGASGSPVWFYSTECEPLVAPKTNRRIIGAVLSRFSKKNYTVPPEYIYDKSNKEALSKVRVYLDEYATISKKAATWIQSQVGEDNCHVCFYSPESSWKEKSSWEEEFEVEQKTNNVDAMDVDDDDDGVDAPSAFSMCMRL